MTQMSSGITVANPVLNINIGGLTNAEVGLAAIGQTAGDFWTGAYFPYSYSSTINNLLWSDGTVSGINVLISNAPGDWANGATDPMLRMYAYSYSGDITVTLTGVPAGTYALYLYGHGPNHGRFHLLGHRPEQQPRHPLHRHELAILDLDRWGAIRSLSGTERLQRPAGLGGRAC